MSPVERDLRGWLRKLRELVPPAFPVRVRRDLVAGDDLGDCGLVRPDRGSPYFSVRLRPTLRGDHLQLVLMHEWAEALSWSSEHPNFEDHGPEFGLAYSRVYCALVETP